MNSLFKGSFHCCHHPLVLRSLLFSYHNFFFTSILMLSNIGMECWKNLQSSTLQAKVFAWLPFSNQLFWFRENFLQIKLQFQEFRCHGDQNGCNLEGWSWKIHVLCAAKHQFFASQRAGFTFDHYFDLCVDDIYFCSIRRTIQFWLSLWATIKYCHCNNIMLSFYVAI